MVLLQISKRVAIKNKGLQVLYITLLLSVALLCALNFVWARKYSSIIPNAPQLRAAFGLQSSEDTSGFNKSTDPFCLRLPSSFHEVPHPDSHVSEKNLSYRMHCRHISVDPCPIDSTCQSIWEAGQIASPFEIEATLNTLVWGDTQMPNKSVLNLYYHPVAQALSASFDYLYGVTEQPESFFGWNAARLSGTNKNTRTIVLDRDGRPAETFEAGQIINMKFPRILHLANFGNVDPLASFDDHEATHFHPHLIKGLFPKGDMNSGSATEFPTWVWGTGATVGASVNCFTDDYDLKKASSVDYDWNLGASGASPICLLHFYIIHPESKTMDTSDLDLGVRREVNGLRLICRVGTSGHRFWSLNALVLFFTSVTVFLSLPPKVIRLITLNCLGHLSHVYRSALVQELSIQDEVCRAVMQLVMSMASFSSIVDSDGELSRQRVQELVHAAVGDRSADTDEDELASLSEFAYSHVLKVTQKTRGQGVRLRRSRIEAFDFKNSLTLGDSATDNDDQASLSKDSYCITTGHEFFTVDAVLKLFDADRKRGPGEVLFTPAFLRKQICRSRKDLEDESQRRIKVDLRKGRSGILEEEDSEDEDTEPIKMSEIGEKCEMSATITGLPAEIWREIQAEMRNEMQHLRDELTERSIRQERELKVVQSELQQLHAATTQQQPTPEALSTDVLRLEKQKGRETKPVEEVRSSSLFSLDRHMRRVLALPAPPAQELQVLNGISDELEVMQVFNRLSEELQVTGKGVDELQTQISFLREIVTDLEVRAKSQTDATRHMESVIIGLAERDRCRQSTVTDSAKKLASTMAVLDTMAKNDFSDVRRRLIDLEWHVRDLGPVRLG